jgi:SAM-dependent methyltransferase
MSLTQEQSINLAASFFHVLIGELVKENRGFLKILDFGCGAGRLVGDLRALGHETYGCDTWSTFSLNAPADERLREITQKPYRIPFDAQAFDFVVSTSVFEHAQNKEECFREIHRVLKPGGYAIHLLPGKWYLPTEPHIYVPLVNWFWPRVPRWWLGLWAFLGVRNEFQKEMTWRHVRDSNYAYCEKGLSYWSTRRYREVSDRIFGRYFYPMELFVSQPGGGFNRLAQKLPFKKLMGLISREFRMGVLVQQKARAS